ncbi:MAG: 50S ribosomal protein L15, partial [Candidatus Omnitrophica bacterium]|nr:50S ribosomal protein L15 [Candidatus Omnitrophota bacterium]
SLRPPKGSHKKKKILGRGPSSGHGKTSGRGTKGQTSRPGRHFYIGFEGGSLPLIRKLPKRGFSRSRLKKVYQIVNLFQLSKLKYEEIDPEVLEKEGLIKDKNKLTKILGEGEIKRPLKIKAHVFSKSAKEKIEKVGGGIEEIHA